MPTLGISFFMGQTIDYKLPAGNLLKAHSGALQLKRKDDTGKPATVPQKESNKLTLRTDKQGLQPRSHSSRVAQHQDQVTPGSQDVRLKRQRSRSPVASGSGLNRTPRGGNHNQSGRGHSRSRVDRNHRGNDASSARTEYKGRQNVKSSGNAPPKKGAEAKDMEVPKTVILEETKAPTPIWNQDNLPPVYRESPHRPSRSAIVVVIGGRHLRAIQEKLGAMDDPSVIYIYLENTNDIAKICGVWSEDRMDRDFSKHDVHYLITDFEVNEEQPASYHIEALRNLMDSHRQACVDNHGYCQKRCSMIALHLINSPSDGWPENRWEAPETVADRTSKPPLIAAINGLLTGLNQQFSDVSGFRPTLLCDIESAGYLDCFKDGNLSLPDTAYRAHVLNSSLRKTWGERLLRLVTFLKNRGHE